MNETVHEECLLCHNNSVGQWETILKKTKQTLKNLWNFLVSYITSFFYITLPLEILDKTTKLHRWKFCYTPWKFQGQKPRLLETPYDYFLITPAPVDNSIHFVFN